MPVGVIVGGQFGSEGKGKVTQYFTKSNKVDIAVRVGGPNSGHTAVIDSTPYVFRQLPIGMLNGSVGVIARGSYVDVDLLMYEISILNKLSIKFKLYIDNYAFIITEEDKEDEKYIVGAIGSTGSGTGAALKKRISRIIPQDGRFAKCVVELEPFLKDTQELMYNCLSSDENYILVEGTQGFGLSNINSDYWPYVTARDTTAAGFINEAGLSPVSVEDIIMCIRTMPIRVSGDSGPMKNEITWEEVSNVCGREVKEYTSCTNRIRRVAKFDVDLVNRAIMINKPNIIVLNHCDYLVKGDVSDYDKYNDIKCIIECYTAGIIRPVTHFGTSNLPVLYRCGE